MPINHIKVIVIALLLLMVIAKVDAQENTACYEYLSLKTFLATKIENDTNFVKQIYRNVKYPPLARENEIEGKIEVILMNHESEGFEVIILNQPLVFHSLEGQIKTALSNLKIDQAVPFVTRFYIIFSLDAARYPREMYKKFHLGLYNDNTFNIVEYILPMVDQN